MMKIQRYLTIKISKHKNIQLYKSSNGDEKNFKILFNYLFLTNYIFDF